MNAGDANEEIATLHVIVNQVVRRGRRLNKSLSVHATKARVAASELIDRHVLRHVEAALF